MTLNLQLINRNKGGAMKPSGRKKVTFQVRADPGSKVYVAGSFNNWDTTKNKLAGKEGFFSLNMFLPSGRHEYKFVVNNNWTTDPNCANSSPDGHGSVNSVVTVD